MVLEAERGVLAWAEHEWAERCGRGEAGEWRTGKPAHVDGAIEAVSKASVGPRQSKTKVKAEATEDQSRRRCQGRMLS